MGVAMATWHKYGDTAEQAAEVLVGKLEDRIRQVDALYAEHKMLRNALSSATKRMCEASDRLQNLHLLLARELDTEIARCRAVLAGLS
jgi:hypothetical protein